LTELRKWFLREVLMVDVSGIECIHVSVARSFLNAIFDVISWMCEKVQVEQIKQGDLRMPIIPCVNGFCLSNFMGIMPAI
jgi:hypothetical protein